MKSQNEVIAAMIFAFTIGGLFLYAAIKGYRVVSRRGGGAPTTKLGKTFVRVINAFMGAMFILAGILILFM